ncbi:hypothetical protein [uncultured Winogradskyella sp.]|uniref:hypothetical protein n=1 Tax=uncultured Winogradskyella sp. TaxID=395353 RepID=UPI002601E527|nr:hypothetical protein [uncultured Winogradskyella sp.]|tara:strand:- start:605 stop:1519 length:915 start_codon:yes stop_codon:yes gene_type:complete
MKKISLAIVAMMVTFLGFSQEEGTQKKSNVQEFTPSKLLSKGQWDIKFFNSLYTQTKQTGAGTGESFTIDRQNFFTNTTEIYTGVSNNSRINVGFIFQVRANNYGGQNALSVFDFKNNGVDSRSGLTTIAPSIRVQPFASVPNFSFTSSLYLPVFKDEAVPAYLDKRSTFWETKFFYDKTFGGGDWQIFTEADFGFNFGENQSDADALTENSGERFANNSMFLPLSAFLSYFPSSKSTLFVNAQQAFLIDLGNNFEQNYTQLGFGGKYQLTDVLNIEASYGKFVRGNNFQGLGETFSIGLRALL